MTQDSKFDYSYMYDGRWKKIRHVHLKRNPLCVYCLQLGKVTAAGVVDHIIPHKGDKVLFYDRHNLQSLCKQCHDGVKQVQENKGYAQGCGCDGIPVDPNHPWNEE